MIKLNMPLLCIFMMSNVMHGEINMPHVKNHPDSVRLERIVLPENSVLYEILEDVMSETENDNIKGRIFKVIMDDYKSGVQVNIEQEVEHKVGEGNPFIGYFPYQNDTIILTGEQRLDFTYSMDQNPIYLPLHNTMKYDLLNWTYWFKGSLIARYAYSLGWLWHIKSEDLKESKNTKYILTAPKRRIK